MNNKEMIKKFHNNFQHSSREQRSIIGFIIIHHRIASFSLHPNLRWCWWWVISLISRWWSQETLAGICQPICNFSSSCLLVHCWWALRLFKVGFVLRSMFHFLTYIHFTSFSLQLAFPYHHTFLLVWFHVGIGMRRAIFKPPSMMLDGLAELAVAAKLSASSPNYLHSMNTLPIAKTVTKEGMYGSYTVDIVDDSKVSQWALFAVTLMSSHVISSTHFISSPLN